MNVELNKLATDIYKANKEKGFWDKERNVGEMLMLVTSELGEAMESHRKGIFVDMDDYVKKLEESEFQEAFGERVKDTFEDEIADAIIRLFDMAGGLGIDLDFHIENKLKYNSLRERLHGKNY